MAMGSTEAVDVAKFELNENNTDLMYVNYHSFVLNVSKNIMTLYSGGPSYCKVVG